MLKKMKMTNLKLKRSQRQRLSAILATVGLISLLCLALASGNKGFNYQVISVNKGYGYEITQNGKVFIHQDCIPSVNGIQPFNTRKEAEEVAKLVVQKLRKGQSPTVSTEEVGFVVMN